MGILERFFGRCIGFSGSTQEGTSTIHANADDLLKHLGPSVPLPSQGADLWCHFLQQRDWNGYDEYEATTNSCNVAELLGGADPAVLLEFAGEEEPVQPGLSVLERFRSSGRLLLNINFCGMQPSDTVDLCGQLLHAAYRSCQAVRLNPRYANDALRSLLRCPTPDVYEAVLAELLSSEPLLRAAIKDSCIAVVEGTAAAAGTGLGNRAAATAHPLVVQHPLPGSGSRILLPLTIQPVIVRRPRSALQECPLVSGSVHGHPAAAGAAALQPLQQYDLLAAVVLRYSLSAGVCVMNEQLHRCLTALSGLPSSVTLLSGDGCRVLYQNTASVRYMGLRQGSTASMDAGLDPGLFTRLNAQGADGAGDGAACRASHSCQAGRFGPVGVNVDGTGGDGGGGGGRESSLRYGWQTQRCDAGAWEEVVAAACERGRHLGGNSDASGGGLLGEVFSLSPQLWAEVVGELAARRCWKGIVRVPRLLTRQMVSEPEPAARSTGPPRRGDSAGAAVDGGECEEGQEEITVVGGCSSSRAALESAGTVHPPSTRQVLDCVPSWDRLTLLRPPAQGTFPPPLDGPHPLRASAQAALATEEAAGGAASSSQLLLGAVAGRVSPLRVFAPGSFGGRVGGGGGGGDRGSSNAAAFRHISAPGVPVWPTMCATATGAGTRTVTGNFSQESKPSVAPAAAAVAGGTLPLASPNLKQQPQLPGLAQYRFTAESQGGGGGATTVTVTAAAAATGGSVRSSMPAVPEAAVTGSGEDAAGEVLLMLLMRHRESVVSNASGSQQGGAAAAPFHSMEPLCGIDHDGSLGSTCYSLGGFGLPQRPTAGLDAGGGGGSGVLPCSLLTSPSVGGEGRMGGGGSSSTASRWPRCVSGGGPSNDGAAGRSGAPGARATQGATSACTNVVPPTASAVGSSPEAAVAGGATVAADLRCEASRTWSLDMCSFDNSARRPFGGRPARTSLGVTPSSTPASENVHSKIQIQNQIQVQNALDRSQGAPCSAGDSQRGASRGDQLAPGRGSQQSMTAATLAVAIPRGSSGGGAPGSGGGFSPTGRVMSLSLRQSIELRRNALGLMSRPAGSGGGPDNPLSTSTWALLAHGACRGAGGNALKRNTSFGAAILRAGSGHPHQQPPRQQQQQQAPRASRSSTGILSPNPARRSVEAASPKPSNGGDSGCCSDKDLATAAAAVAAATAVAAAAAAPSEHCDSGVVAPQAAEPSAAPAAAAAAQQLCGSSSSSSNLLKAAHLGRYESRKAQALTAQTGERGEGPGSGLQSSPSNTALPAARTMPSPTLRGFRSAPPLVESLELADQNQDDGAPTGEFAAAAGGSGGGSGCGWPSRLAPPPTAVPAATAVATAGAAPTGAAAAAVAAAATAALADDGSRRSLQPLAVGAVVQGSRAAVRRATADGGGSGTAAAPTPQAGRTGKASRGIALAAASLVSDGLGPAGLSSFQLAPTTSTAPSASTSASTLAAAGAPPLPTAVAASAPTPTRSRLWFRNPLRSRTLSTGNGPGGDRQAPRRGGEGAQTAADMPTEALAEGPAEISTDASGSRGSLGHRIIRVSVRRAAEVMLPKGGTSTRVEDPVVSLDEAEQGMPGSAAEEGCGATATATVEEDMVVADSAAVGTEEEAGREYATAERQYGTGTAEREYSTAEREYDGGEGDADAGGDGDEDSSEGCCWHEVSLTLLDDEKSSSMPMILLVQTDVTARVRAEHRIARVLEAEHQLLESIFPRHVLELAASTARKGGGRAVGAAQYRLAQLPLPRNSACTATYHPMVTIVFADIKGFTSLCHEIPATKVMEFLNNLYSRLDTLLDVYGVYKVETIGDCYMVAGGLMVRDADGFMSVRGPDSVDELHAAKAMAFAKAMLREASHVLLPTTRRPVEMRIGLHSGPVMSGIVGSKMPRFCLFGDTVNTASRMESTCPPGAIHVSATTRALLTDEEWEPTGGVQVKGIGMMDTFSWRGDVDDERISLVLGLGLGADALTAAAAACHGMKRSSAGAMRIRARRASTAVVISSGTGTGTGAGTAATCTTASPALGTSTGTSTAAQRTPASAASPLGGESSAAGSLIERGDSSAAAAAAAPSPVPLPQSRQLTDPDGAVLCGSSDGQQQQRSHPNPNPNQNPVLAAGGGGMAGSASGMLEAGLQVLNPRRTARNRLKRSCSSLAASSRRVGSGSSSGGGGGGGGGNCEEQGLMLLKRELSQMPISRLAGVAASAARPTVQAASHAAAAAVAAAMESAGL